MYAWRWHGYYGGMQWWFNSILHIPGDPVLLLYSRPNPNDTGGELEIIKVEGDFFLHMVDRARTFKLQEDITLEEVLSMLNSRGSVPHGPVWPTDRLALYDYEAWSDRVYRIRTELLGSFYGY